MRPYSIFILSVSLFACANEQSGSDTQEDQTTVPENVLDSTIVVSGPDDAEYLDGGPGDIDYFQIGQFEILEQVEGDLDKDGTDETVIAYDTHVEGEWGTERVIYIYKATQGGGWEEWITSTGAIMPSESGGMMGDGFDGMEIKNGVLHVRHWGGSREKWSYTHKYRYQDGDFYLIGASSTAGAPCDYWQDFDYNLSTGDATYRLEHDKCPGEDWESDYEEANEKFNISLDALPRFKNIVVTENSITNPNTGKAHYF